MTCPTCGGLEKLGVVWVPLTAGDDVFYRCEVELFGHAVSAVSRSRAQALSYALGEVARRVRTQEQLALPPPSTG